MQVCAQKSATKMQVCAVSSQNALFSAREYFSDTNRGSGSFLRNYNFDNPKLEQVPLEGLGANQFLEFWCLVQTTDFEGAKSQIGLWLHTNSNSWSLEAQGLAVVHKHLQDAEFLRKGLLLTGSEE